MALFSVVSGSGYVPSRYVPVGNGINIYSKVWNSQFYKIYFLAQNVFFSFILINISTLETSLCDTEYCKFSFIKRDNHAALFEVLCGPVLDFIILF